MNTYNLFVTALITLLLAAMPATSLANCNIHKQQAGSKIAPVEQKLAGGEGTGVEQKLAGGEGTGVEGKVLVVNEDTISIK